jgi:CO dehydrogenase maturation factor
MIVIDAEAGMEQLSRRTLKDVDTLLILTDPSIPGLRSARRILELSKNLRIGFRSSWILANKVRNESQRRMIGKYVARENLPLIGEIPWDEEVEKADFDGRPLIDLEGKAEEAIGEIIKKLGIWT